MRADSSPLGLEMWWSLVGEVTARLYFDKNDPVERGSFDDTMRVERTLSRGRRLLFHSKVEIGLHKKQGQLIFLTGRKEAGRSWCTNACRLVDPVEGRKVRWFSPIYFLSGRRIEVISWV